MLVPVLLLSFVAITSGTTATCNLDRANILSSSSSGVAQISNLRLIELTCSVPARPEPTKPGESRNGLRATTRAFEIDANGSKKQVESDVQVSGGSQSGSEESVEFSIDIPLDTAERVAEYKRWLDKLNENAPPHLRVDGSRQNLERESEDISQNRVGHFLVECSVTDGSTVIAIGKVEFEVLFMGRFSDYDSFPGDWPSEASPVGR